MNYKALSAATEGKYGTITASDKDFHPDEPVFLIRATDPLAVTAVNNYRRLAIEADCPDEFIREISDHKMRISQWQAEHPELVKVAPD